MMWRSFVAAALVVLSACDSRLGREMGVSDPVAAPPLVTDILADASLESPLTPERLEVVCWQEVARVADRPGSSVTVWALQRNGFKTVPLASVRVPACTPASLQAKKAERAAFIEQSVRQLHDAAATIFQQSPLPRSELVAGLGRICLARSGTTAERRLVAATDGMEASDLGNFESCSLPRPQEVLVTVQHAGTLPDAAFRNTRIIFAYMDAGSAGCQSPRTAQERRRIWEALARAGNAISITFCSDAPDGN